MTMSPEEIEAQEFELVRRGYDRDAVRRFLTAVATDHRLLRADGGGDHEGDDGFHVARIAELEAQLEAAQHWARTSATDPAAEGAAQAQEAAEARAVEVVQDGERRAAAIVAAAEVRAGELVAEQQILDGVADEARQSAEARVAEAEARVAELTAALEAARAVPAAGPWDRMAEQVAVVMRTAEEQASVALAASEAEAAELRQQAVADAEALRSSAEQYASDLRADAASAADLARVDAEQYVAELRTGVDAWAEHRQGEIEADREEAQRQLAAAQAEALALVADAQGRADRMLEVTERRSRARADELLAEADTRLGRLADIERSAQARLLEATGFLQRAVESFTPTGGPADGDEDTAEFDPTAVLDLSDSRAVDDEPADVEV